LARRSSSTRRAFRVPTSSCNSPIKNATLFRPPTTTPRIHLRGGDVAGSGPTTSMRSGRTKGPKGLGGWRRPALSTIECPACSRSPPGGRSDAASTPIEPGIPRPAGRRGSLSTVRP
jgi:hypothetical protein